MLTTATNMFLAVIPMYIHVHVHVDSLAHHNATVYEAPSHVIWSQVRILFGGRHGNIPDMPPSIIERLVDWVDSGVMGRDGVVGGKCREGVGL